MESLKILIASNNAGKLREIQEILEREQVNFVLPNHMGIELKVKEDGNTYKDNAARKAVAFSKASGLICLADDSGLEVDALNGAPGVNTAQFIPWPRATDSERRHYLIDCLKGKPKPWSARFHCTIAIATPKSDLFFTEGEVFGEIIEEEIGTGGFGFDPIFFIPHLGLTMAQLSSFEKNKISHRANAIRAAYPVLKNLLITNQ